MIIKTILAFIFLFFLCEYSWCAQLHIHTQKGKTGDMILIQFMFMLILIENYINPKMKGGDMKEN